MPHIISAPPNWRLVWIDRDETSNSLVCIRYDDGHRIYRHTNNGWTAVTGLIDHEPHDEWPSYSLPKPQLTSASTDHWLTIELAAFILTAQGWK